VEYVPTLFPDDGSAIERGNAYHRVMELVDFNKPLKTEVISQIEAFTSNGLMEREYAEMVDADKIVAILKDDYFRMDGARYFRELPFEVLVPAELAMPGSGDEEVLVQGVIDLIAFTEDGIYIADYKVSGRGCDALKQAYARQLELYAFAAERITGKRVLGKRLYNLSSGERIEL
jgi:ATP-dependent helicase/nuclease subunit A